MSSRYPRGYDIHAASDAALRRWAEVNQQQVNSGRTDRSRLNLILAEINERAGVTRIGYREEGKP